MNNGYVVITPAYNESGYIERTIESVLAQSILPLIWVIVDDGSSDKTWDIISLAAKSHSWIEAHRREKDINVKQVNDGLIAASEAIAFLEGLKIAQGYCKEPEYIVKLDADLQFEKDYFQMLLSEFDDDQSLGIAGGVIYEYKEKELVREKISTAHVRGATKIYAAQCYEDIGGVLPVFGWDVIDEMLARDSGWHVSSFEHVHLVHLRRTASRGGRFGGWARNGYMAYYIGMSPLRVFLRSLFRLFSTGDIVQASGIVCGYFSNYFRRSKTLDDNKIRKVVKKYQWVTAKQSLRD